MATSFLATKLFILPHPPKVIRSVYMERIENGKIAEHWGEENGVSLLEQLGVIPKIGEI